MAITKKDKKQKCWQGCEEREHLCTVGGNSLKVPQKIKNTTTLWFNNPTSEYIFKGNEINI